MNFTSSKDYENKLKSQLESFLNKSEDWKPEDFLSIKGYLFQINNHISYLLGKAFLDALGVSNDSFKYTDMNNNGYDLEIFEDDKLIIGEIKGNVPCGKNNTYGAQQKDKIKENLDCLNDKSKKRKSKLTIEQFDEAYKFLILLDNNKEAIKNLEKNENKKSTKYLLHYPNEISWHCFKKDMINIIFIDLSR